MRLNTFLGFALAPLLVPVVIVICVLVIPRFPLTQIEPNTWSARVREGLSIGVFAGAIGYLVTVFGAVPAHHSLVRRGLTSARVYAALGAVLGVASPLVYAAFVYAMDLSTRDLPLRVLAVFTGVGLACGVPVALLFWTIAVRSHASQQS